jgi:mono/diheme cytochrome c family protein
MKLICTLVAFAGMAAAGSRIKQDRVNPFEGQADAIRAGAKLFQRYCASCHGRAAEGTPGKPSLRDRAVVQAPPQELYAILRDGILKRGMPSWASLPEEQRWQIIAFLRTLDATR